MRFISLILILTIISAVHASDGTFVFPKVSCERMWKDKNINQDDLDKTNYSEYYKSIKRNKCFKKWSVLIYMAADNDLSPYSIGDILEMEQVIPGELNLGATTINTDVLVELDTYERTGNKRLHIYQTQEDFNFINSEESITSPNIRTYKETGRGSIINQKIRFKRFLNWGMKNYPAEHFMVVIWGHGEGYIGKNANQALQVINAPNSSSRYLRKEMISIEMGKELQPNVFPIDKVFGGVAFDHSDFSYLDIPSINEIILKSTEKYSPNKKLDILAFDACLMQSVEIATELAESTNYLISSVQIQDYVGFPYRKILDFINKFGPNPFDLTKEIPKLAAESFNGGYQSSTATLYQTFTLSSLNTSELVNQLVPNLSILSDRIQDYLQEDFMRAMDISFILEQGQSFRGESRELGTFLGSLKRLIFEEKLDFGLTPAAKKLNRQIDNTLDAINKSMISYHYGSGYTDPREDFSQNYLLGFFKGIGIWIPSNTELYKNRIEEFKKSKMYQSDFMGTYWSDWFNLL
ncbi:MAG: hypothetical protein HOJ35_09105 [Bdellovibrionales bacterium]|nr:hypothetical protein [Bdellovibrionales bacterium]